MRHSNNAITVLTFAVVLSLLPGCGSNGDGDTNVATDKAAPAEDVATKVEEPKIELPLIGIGSEEPAPELNFAELIADLDRNQSYTDDQVQNLVTKVEAQPADPLVLDAARMVFRSGRSDDVQKVGEAIVAHHLNSPKTIDIVRSCSEARGGVEVLTAINDAADGDLQMVARYWLASRLRSSPQSLELMRQVADYENDLPLGRLTLQSLASGFINAQLHLQIGKVAPDIDGADVHGKTFKLSDYRGRVVVLDFWGDW